MGARAPSPARRSEAGGRASEGDSRHLQNRKTSRQGGFAVVRRESKGRRSSEVRIDEDLARPSPRGWGRERLPRPAEARQEAELRRAIPATSKTEKPPAREVLLLCGGNRREGARARSESMRTSRDRAPRDGGESAFPGPQKRGRKPSFGGRFPPPPKQKNLPPGRFCCCAAGIEGKALERGPNR